MSKLEIAPAKVSGAMRLNKLFIVAVEQHFDYFSLSVRRQVIAQHSVPRLIRAVIDPRRIVLEARLDGQLAGYCIGSVPRTGTAQLYWLYVDPDMRGQNIGLSLLSRSLKLQCEMGASVVSIATHDHCRYYKRQGFKLVGSSKVHGVKMDILEFRLDT